ncbi:MAG: DUF4912 domain-containing protein [Acidobacteria bacterium]|nr:DUF4912 domain-containing protein [Acidobacteriota bacterium]
MTAHAQDEREGDATAAVESPAPRDEARLLVQSPRRLYLYWSFAHVPRATLRRAFGQLADRFRVAARLVDQESGVAAAATPANGRSLWLDAAPGRSYRAEIGFVAEGLPFVRALASNAVETPPDAISRATDGDETFRTDSQGFARMLAVSGFAQYARAAEATDDQARAPSDDEIAASVDEITAGRARLAAASSPPHAASSASFRVAPSSMSRVARRA